ncbi:hypothetical protein Pan216_52630 [Planctomycetes bacterium Pan216]|uniref:Uncharacterized protein n=1 Tax=Kolteria novifilia TaxID=2527975 RepID=A0A518BBU9_9BACT|nr:hypothetical protein Pan216_52630 [Planctomycetes bacterium Pan216]
MKFVLLGSDPHTDSFVRAAQDASHEMIAFMADDGETPEVPSSARRLDGLADVVRLTDVGYAVLAGDFDYRAEQALALVRLEPMPLVLSVPLAEKPDVYYELGLYRVESKLPMLTLLPEAAHPGLAKLREWTGETSPQWMEWTLPFDPEQKGSLRFHEGWSWIRSLGGEIEEISATGGDESGGGSQLLVSARHQSGILTTIRWRALPSEGYGFRLETTAGTIEGTFERGCQGPVTLIDRRGGQLRTETHEPFDVGPTWVAEWEALREKRDDEAWHRGLRQIELASATNESLERHRAVSLEYSDVSEQQSFRSIMTLTGCGMLMGLVLVVIVAAIMTSMGVFGNWQPPIFLGILGVLALFCSLQLLGLLFRPAKPPKPSPRDEDSLSHPD